MESVSYTHLDVYKRQNKIIACGGTWMVKKDLIEAENWDEIERLTREAVNTMLGFEVKHLSLIHI